MPRLRHGGVIPAGEVDALGGDEAVTPTALAEARAMTLQNVTLDDKYDLAQARVFVTGYQALIRATLMQQERDRLAGLNTAGYVSGYRGSPLGGLDPQFMRAPPQVPKTNVIFQTGLNARLAA